jgi:hypothetical protein
MAESEENGFFSPHIAAQHMATLPGFWHFQPHMAFSAA